MVCSCKSGCDTKRCSCKLRGEPCEVKCHCISCRNQPASSSAVVKTTAGAVVTTPDDDEMQVEAVEVTTGGSLTRAAAQSTNQQIVHRVHRNFDKAGVLRSETTETIDTRAHNVLLFEQVIPPNALRMLRDAPHVQQLIGQGRPLANAAATSLVAHWVAQVGQRAAASLYTPNAQLQVSCGGAVDFVEGSEAIGRYLAFFSSFRWDVGEVEDVFDPEHLKMRHAGALMPAGDVGSGVTALTAALLDYLRTTGGAPVRFERQLACLTQVDGQLLPIHEDNISILLS